MKCPFCGQVDLKLTIRDMPYSFRGCTTVIAAVTGEYCEACGEMILAAGEADRVGAAMQDFQQTVGEKQAATVANRC